MLSPSVSQDPGQEPGSGQRAREAAIKSASRMAKWKEAIENVKQSAVVAIDDPSDQTTGFEITGLPSIRPTPKSSNGQIELLKLISFEPLQEWEGVVREVSKEVFTATLLDITARLRHEGEIADFPVADVSEDDRPFLQPGGVFRWLIGYERHPSGVKRRVSSIVFRRLAEWTNHDLLRAEKDAEQLLRTINWE